ncbi:MAG TPA: M20 family metallopeptidase [Thermodesulfobacteriota bacterium]
MADLSTQKARAKAVVEAAGPELDRLADRIHANPELGYEERQAAAWLGEFLAERGFHVTHGVGGVATAFVAETGPARPGAPTVAMLAEYDALPNIGHACGHNLIAAIAVGAGLACRDLVPPEAGRVIVLGTPAEEGGGGKQALLDAGVFDGIDAAMMIHPWDRTAAWAPALGLIPFKVAFHGRNAHAAGAPHLGVNALDAMILLFTGIGLLRQQITGDARIHGVITRGGDKPNIIPDYTEAEFYVRALDPAYVAELHRRVLAVAEGAATATGCRMTTETTGYAYDPVREYPTLSALFRRNLEALGLSEAPGGGEMAGSTDFGNVSQRIPGLHAYLEVADRGTSLHTPTFAAAAAAPRAKAMIRAGATVLAQTALDLLLAPGALDRARAERP